MRRVRLIGLTAWVAAVAAGCLSEPAVTSQRYVVQPRDTLYSIAWRHDLDYRDLARWNHIGPDYRITVGQVLMLTPGGAAAAPRVEAAAPRNARPTLAASPRSGAQPLDLPGAAAGQPCGAEPPDSQPTAAQHWTWPTAPASALRSVPGGGILLLGTLGQPIRAACAGRVVYAGSGIRGYGNLIIIKHGDTVLSAYAHTLQVAVHEGQEVATGEQIARMGTGAHDVAALYFEIRRNGKPVDPRPFLPAAPGPPAGDN